MRFPTIITTAYPPISSGQARRIAESRSRVWLNSSAIAWAIVSVSAFPSSSTPWIWIRRRIRS